MKKLLSIVILITVLLSCCACAKQEAQTAAPAETVPATTLDPASPEAMYGHIDQTQPVDGVYKIWNAEGVKNIKHHPDARFELLCHVDMQGAELAPIPEFTGTLDGMNCTISNFTVKGAGADFGFVTVNKGKINNLYLDRVTFQPEGAANMGGFAGRNEGTILRCTITNGTMAVEKAAQNANCGAFAGVNKGEISNSAAAVDILYTAPGKANVGGIAGTIDGGKLEYVDTNGKLAVTGQEKTFGLMAAVARNTTLNSCAFVGAENTLDGQLVTDFFGTEENVTREGLLLRDNSRPPEDPVIQVKREKAVQNMYEMCTIVWKPENLVHTCVCDLNPCNGTYSNTYTWLGQPYNHKGGSLARMKYCMNEDGTLKDWVYELGEQGSFDTFDLYIGNDCSTCVQQAWWTVSNSVEFLRSSYQTPAAAGILSEGLVPVGQWEWDLGLDPTSTGLITKYYTEKNGREVMYEAYAQMRMGDGVGYFYEGAGHSRMVATDAVVVRDESGKIDGTYSYVTCHEQGKGWGDDEKGLYSYCSTYQKYTFDNLYNGHYLPVTVEEFVTGQFDEPTCILEDGLEEDSRFALTTGTVKANYSLDYVVMTITDESGNVVFDHWMFPSATKMKDAWSNDTQIRNLIKEFDLAGFAIPLKDMVFDIGGTYHATITGSLATGDNFVVKDFTFTNG